MPRHFDPITLRLFVAVCEEHNIARAAEREAIVASAVSKRIAQIENEIGTPLLVRGRRGIEPTAAGDALLRQARDLLGMMERMHVELSEFSTGVQGSVRVAASVSVLAERLPEDIARFLGLYQDVRVSLDERVSVDILRHVREGSADIGVLWDVADRGGLHSVDYRSDHLCVAVNATHPLVHKRRVNFRDTLQHASIGVTPGGMMEAMLRRQAALAGQTMNHRIQVSSLDAACRIVAAGLGLAILPLEAIEPHAAASSLRLLPLTEPWAHRRFVICSRPEGLTSATTRLLIDHLRQQASGAE